MFNINLSNKDSLIATYINNESANILKNVSFSKKRTIADFLLNNNYLNVSVYSSLCKKINKYYSLNKLPNTIDSRKIEELLEKDLIQLNSNQENKYIFDTIIDNEEIDILLRKKFVYDNFYLFINEIDKYGMNSKYEDYLYQLSLSDEQIVFLSNKQFSLQFGSYKMTIILKSRNQVKGISKDYIKYIIKECRDINVKLELFIKYENIFENNENDICDLFNDEYRKFILSKKEKINYSMLNIYFLEVLKNKNIISDYNFRSDKSKIIYVKWYKNV